MKFIVAPIFFVLLLSLVFSHCIIVISFNLDRDYISKTLCENRQQPKLNCECNCILMKKMKEEQNEHGGTSTVKAEMPTVVLSSKSFFATMESPVFKSNTDYNLPGNSGRSTDRAAGIFHPPI